jgi:hypothetical protein
MLQAVSAGKAIHIFYMAKSPVVAQAQSKLYVLIFTISINNSIFLSK